MEESPFLLRNNLPTFTISSWGEFSHLYERLRKDLNVVIRPSDVNTKIYHGDSNAIFHFSVSGIYLPTKI